MRKPLVTRLVNHTLVGMYGGQVLDPGVFVFAAIIEKGNGERENLNGDVTLIR